MTTSYEELDPLKHGIYAMRLSRQELNSLRKMPYDDIGPEIAVLRLMISRMLPRCTAEKDDQTAAILMNSITHAARSLNTLIRTYAQLDDDRQNSTLDQALHAALAEEPFYLTGDPPPPSDTPPDPHLTPEEEERWREIFEVVPHYPADARHPTHFRPLRRQPSRYQLRRRKARAAARLAPAPAKKPIKKPAKKPGNNNSQLPQPTQLAPEPVTPASAAITPPTDALSARPNSKTSAPRTDPRTPRTSAPRTDAPLPRHDPHTSRTPAPRTDAPRTSRTPAPRTCSTAHTCSASRTCSAPCTSSTPRISRTSAPDT